MWRRVMSDSSKGEEAVNDFLKAKNVLFEREQTFPELRSPADKSLLPVGFAININGAVGIIEYNGSQHYNPIGNSPEAADAYVRLSKNGSARLNFSKKQNIPLLIIHFKDFDRIHEIVGNFLKDMQKKTKNKTVKYTGHSKGFFKGYPYQTFENATNVVKAKPFELIRDEKHDVFQLPDDAVITSKTYLNKLQSYHDLREQTKQKFQAAVADLVVRVNELQNANQDLEQTINELKMQLHEQDKIITSHNVVTFDGEFRISPSNRSQLTDDARNFIKRLSHRFDNDWNKVRSFIGDNYQEKISVKTIKKVCATPEEI